MRYAFCLEQTLGHRAHTANLERILSQEGGEAVVIKVEPGQTRLPWALAASLRARAQINGEAARHEVRFFHTQSVALLAPLMRCRTPYVVSVDATPIQMDAMGHWYDHSRGSRVAETAKRLVYRAVFGRAAAIVAWSEWAASSLTDDYGVPPDRILVIHPGATRDFLQLPEREGGPNRKPTILFVGGDFERKGGRVLLEACAPLMPGAKLVVVSSAEFPIPEGVEVIRNATPGSRELLNAYGRADVFCLPTLADCTPMVLGEAMAAGLPIVTTRVGSNAETVTHGHDGLLVDTGDVTQLRTALERLIHSPLERHRMGNAARSTARSRFDAERNGARILRMMESLA